MKNFIKLTLLCVFLVGCAGQKFKTLKPLNSDESLEQFLSASCLSSEGDVLLTYFTKSEPRVSYESFFDKNYKNWGLAISIPFRGEEDLHLNWRKTFLVEGSIGSKLKSSSFNRILRRYQISRSEIMRGLNFWADSIDVISRAKDVNDKVNREKLVTRTEFDQDKYIIKKEVSENLHFLWTFKNLRKNYFEEQMVEFYSPVHKQSIKFTFFVRECLK